MFKRIKRSLAIIGVIFAVAGCTSANCEMSVVKAKAECSFGNDNTDIILY